MTTKGTPAINRESGYIPCLDGIRACAFLIVFMAHAVPGRLGTYIPATFGVTVFFFLSGFLITTLLRRERVSKGSISLKDFYIRRAFRILPPMYLAYGVTLVLAGMGILAQKGNLAGAMSSLCYYYNYSQLLTTNVSVPTGMTVLWSLSIEEHFYFIFPLAYVVLLHKRVSVGRQCGLLLMMCLLGLLWRMILLLIIKPPILGHLSWTYAATDARFDSLLWGCLLAIGANPLFDNEAMWLKNRSGRFAIAGLGLIAASMLFRQPLYREGVRYSLQGIGLLPVFYYCITSPQQWQVRWLEWRPLRWIGWLSYSLYLIHNAFLLQLHQEYPKHIVADGVVALGGSILYAWVVREGVELPLQRVRKRIHWISKKSRDTGIAAVPVAE